MADKVELLEFEFDSLRTLREDDDLALAEIDLLHLGVNRNSCDISRECVERSKDSFYNKPIIYRYNSKLSDKLATDFVEHSRDGDPTMNIAGHIPWNSNIEYVERNGKTYVRVMCVLHKAYLPSLMRILEKKNGNTKVSIEIVVLDGQRTEGGILKIDAFKLRGVCLLGDEILEGIEGSQLNVVKFSASEYNDYYDKVFAQGKDYFSGWVYIPSTHTYQVFSKGGKEEMFDAAIIIDKSKEALSDKPWGDVDKTDLRNKVLSASNAKALVSAVYLLVESGWEDSPSTKLKYPVMEIENGKAFYNRHALSSALGYARAEGETEVVKKVEEIYKNLDIEEDRKENSFMEIENKLDEHNKDIEEIRDDAEAQEDDVKEELDESLDIHEEEECEDNAFEPHDKGEEGLEDDVDADKDYWKKKAEDNAAQLEEMNKRLMALEKEKEMACMDELLKEYEICLEEDSIKSFKDMMANMSIDQFSAKLYEHVAKCALDEKMNNCGNQAFSHMPSNVGVQIDSKLTLENMSKKYSKK